MNSFIVFLLYFPISRDRNREHAKNTRLRKKAYVHKLKELVDKIGREQEIEERHRQALGEKIYETVYFLVIVHFLRLLFVVIMFFSSDPLATC